MLFFALAALIVATVWFGVVLRWGSVVTVGLSVLVTGTVVGPYFFAVNGPVQISIDRLLWGVMVVIFFAHRRMGRTEPKSLGRGEWALLAFLVLTFFSAKLGDPPSDGSNPVARWLFYIAMPVGTFFAVRGAKIGDQEVKWLLRVLVALGCYVATMALFEVSGWHAFVFPRYIVNPEQWEFFGRARGPLMNPSANGILLTICLGAALACWQSSGRGGRLGYAAVMGLMLLGCAATLTRCVWLGAVGFLAITIFMTLPRHWKGLAIVSVSVLGATAGPLAIDAFLTMKRDKNLSAQAAKESIELRPLLAVTAWEMFQDRPFLGHGFGRYLDNNTEYVQRHQWDLPLANAQQYVQHNILLSILVDCGMIGLLLYAGVLGWWLWIAFALYRRSATLATQRLGLVLLAALVGYIINGMFQDATIFPMIHLYLALLAGLAVGATEAIGGRVVAKAFAPAATFNVGLGHWPERRQTTLPPH